MTPRRIRAALAVLVAALALAGCTSSGNGTSTGGATPSGMPTDAAGLSALVRSAVDKLTAAKIKVGISVSGQQLSGTGAEQLSGGNLSALDMTLRLAGAGNARVVVAGGKTYAQLPAPLNPSGKPWLLVTPTSSNATIRQVAPLLAPVLSMISPAAFSELVAAAKSIDVKGTGQVGGVRATHYVIEVEIAKLPESFPGKAALGSAAGATMPFELYVDAQGRPLRATPQLTVQGQDVPIDVEYSSFDAPVSVTAPPASSVGS